MHTWERANYSFVSWVRKSINRIYLHNENIFCSLNQLLTMHLKYTVSISYKFFIFHLYCKNLALTNVNCLTLFSNQDSPYIHIIRTPRNCTLTVSAIASRKQQLSRSCGYTDTRASHHPGLGYIFSFVRFYLSAHVRILTHIYIANFEYYLWEKPRESSVRYILGFCSGFSSFYGLVTSLFWSFFMSGNLRWFLLELWLGLGNCLIIYLRFVPDWGISAWVTRMIWAWFYWVRLLSLQNYRDL